MVQRLQVFRGQGLVSVNLLFPCKIASFVRHAGAVAQQVLDGNLFPDIALEFREILAYRVFQADFSFLYQLQNSYCSKLFGDRRNIETGISVYHITLREIIFRDGARKTNFPPGYFI